MIIIFNTQEKEININIPNIEKINSSLNGNCGQPNKNLPIEFDSIGRLCF